MSYYFKWNLLFVILLHFNSAASATPFDDFFSRQIQNQGFIRYPGSSPAEHLYIMNTPNRFKMPVTLGVSMGIGMSTAKFRSPNYSRHSSNRMMMIGDIIIGIPTNELDVFSARSITSAIGHELRHVWQARNMPSGKIMAVYSFVGSWVYGPGRAYYAPEFSWNLPNPMGAYVSKHEELLGHFPPSIKSYLNRYFYSKDAKLRATGAILIDEIDAHAEFSYMADEVYFRRARKDMASGSPKRIRRGLELGQSLLLPRYGGLMGDEARDAAESLLKRFGMYF